MHFAPSTCKKGSKKSHGIEWRQGAVSKINDLSCHQITAKTFYLVKASMGDKLAEDTSLQKREKSKSVPFLSAHTAMPLLKLSVGGNGASQRWWLRIDSLKNKGMLEIFLQKLSNPFTFQLQAVHQRKTETDYSYHLMTGSVNNFLLTECENKVEVSI